ncbi:hypothetical protein BH10ACT3_BH10ACT3_06290 [soil metagenome]
MFVSNVVNGLLIGFPLMLAVGPIAILLLDQGLSRGARAAIPASLGVASADLTFSVLAAVAGTSIAIFLAPITSWLSLAAVALLLVLAVRLFRGAMAELRALRPAEAPSVLGDMGGLALDTAFVGPTDVHTGSVDAVGSVVSDDHYSTTMVAPDEYADSIDYADPIAPDADESALNGSDVTFGHLTGVRLGAAFYGLTVVNPLTIVLFAAVVVAGGAGAGTPGWAIGVALSSLIVHSGWVLLGAALGTTLGPVAVACMRLGASFLMAALALHFLLG